MKDRLTYIESKIHQLKQKKDRIQTQHALLFMKEAQKILEEEFSPNLALKILKEHWNKASKDQKEEWKKRESLFPSSNNKTRKTIKNSNPASQQSRKTEISHHEHP